MCTPVDASETMKQVCNVTMNKLDGCAVLVVDDDVDALQLYATCLSKQGANVRVAKNVGIALAILDAWTPDVMLCDLQMPGASGYDLLEGVRADPRLRYLPVIAISAGHPVLERDRSLRAGFAGHLAKPSRLGDIVDSLLGTLNTARAC